MTTTYESRNKTKSKVTKKKRINWQQCLRPKNKPDLEKNLKKSLQYILLLRKFDNNIDYKNVKLLQAFLTKYGKIRPRRKTRITPQQQRLVAKSIRKARAVGLLPFTFDVKI